MRVGLCLFYLWDGLFLYSTDVKGDNATHTEFDLHKRLFQQYISNIMPRNVKSSEPFQVGIELYLMSIDDMNELRQTI
ncbi:hypothetical protein DPMN_006686 [Dreissena polymorpha]|uniref:Uncharacterized protein n=1 Tax=Dreissena polymorpha TaxID=45954 RepID=A0A9D4MUH0_DREPO|nr:hypothetical protein DPMN_006686 [Dreissena polymorpha]